MVGPSTRSGKLLPRDCNRVAPTIEKEEPTMTKVRTWVGLDVHAAATVACVVTRRRVS